MPVTSSVSRCDARRSVPPTLDGDGQSRPFSLGPRTATGPPAHANAKWQNGRAGQRRAFAAGRPAVCVCSAVQDDSGPQFLSLADRFKFPGTFLMARSKLRSARCAVREESPRGGGFYSRTPREKGHNPQSACSFRDMRLHDRNKPQCCVHTHVRSFILRLFMLLCYLYGTLTDTGSLHPGSTPRCMMECVDVARCGTASRSRPT